MKRRFQIGTIRSFIHEDLSIGTWSGEIMDPVTSIRREANVEDFADQVDLVVMNEKLHQWNNVSVIINNKAFIIRNKDNSLTDYSEKWISHLTYMEALERFSQPDPV